MPRAKAIQVDKLAGLIDKEINFWEN